MVTTDKRWPPPTEANVLLSKLVGKLIQPLFGPGTLSPSSLAFYAACRDYDNGMKVHGIF